jgi:hypothetical protein
MDYRNDHFGVTPGVGGKAGLQHGRTLTKQFRLNPAEARVLRLLAQHMRVDESSAIRVAILAAARQLFDSGVPPDSGRE